MAWMGWTINHRRGGSGIIEKKKEVELTGRKKKASALLPKKKKSKCLVDEVKKSKCLIAKGKKVKKQVSCCRRKKKPVPCTRGKKKQVPFCWGKKKQVQNPCTTPPTMINGSSLTTKCLKSLKIVVDRSLKQTNLGLSEMTIGKNWG